MTRAVDSESGGFSTWGVGVAVGENFNAIDSGLTFCSQIVTVCSTNVRELHTWQFQRFDISTKQDHGYSERLQRTKFHTYTWFNVFFTRTLPRKHVLVLTDLFSLVTPSDSIRTSKRQLIKTYCTVKLIPSRTDARISFWKRTIFKNDIVADSALNMIKRLKHWMKVKKIAMKWKKVLNQTWQNKKMKNTDMKLLMMLPTRPLRRGGEPVHYHGPHELCITAGEPQNQLILS